MCNLEARLIGAQSMKKSVDNMWDGRLKHRLTLVLMVATPRTCARFALWFPACPGPWSPTFAEKGMKFLHGGGAPEKRCVTCIGVDVLAGVGPFA